MRNTIFLFLIFIIISCENKTNEKEQTNFEENINSNSIITEYNTDISLITHNLSDISLITHNLSHLLFNNNEIITPNEGILYVTNIIHDTNVYILPDFNSRILETLNTGTSVRIIGTSDNNEKWIKVYYGDPQHYRDNPKMGWIPVSFANIEKPYYASHLEIERMDINQWGNLILYGKYSVNNITIGFTVSANKTESQNFYTFTWDYTCKGFHYSNKPGLYIWNENGLRFISYVGGQGSKWSGSAWAKVTDDFKYLLQDQGTSVHPRTVNIWNLENGEEISFTNNYEDLIWYYADINLKGYSMEIIKEYKTFYNGEWSDSRYSFTNEEITFAQRFIRENDPPQELLDMNYFAFLIVYEYNIETKDKKIIGGKYIFVQ
ncbi:MAG: hypothetical protein FWD47_07835 [Treponema sp.]|nr:hypothetical protein [Treponema sp.]